MLIDSRVDNSKYDFLVTISYKEKYNNESNNYCIKWLKEIYSSNNKYEFYSKNSNKHVKVFIFSAAIVIDIIQNQPYSNCSEGNSTFSPSYN